MYQLKQYCSFCNEDTLHYKINLVAKCKSNNSLCKFKIIQKDINNFKYQNKQEIFICSNCKKCSLKANNKNIDLPDPYYKMDNDLKEIYNEAKSIFNLSLRSALGLLRCIFENLLIRKFNIKNPTKISEILKNQQVAKSLGKNIIDSANNFKNICNIALHSSEMEQDSTKNEILIYFDWINKLAWVISDSDMSVDKVKNTQTNNNFNNKNKNSNNVFNSNANNKNNKHANAKKQNNNQISGATNNLQNKQINNQQPSNKQNEPTKPNNNQQINKNKQNHNNHKKQRNKKWNNKNKDINISSQQSK